MRCLWFRYSERTGSGVRVAPGCDPGRGDRREPGHRDGCCHDEEYAGELPGRRGTDEGCEETRT